jgi:L-threonylcarbamoyladenylate synthase
MTDVYRISPDLPDPELIEKAAAVLRGGGLVAYPTETVYGLAAGAFLAEAVSRVYAAKQRPYNQALPVQIADRNDVRTLAADPSAEALRLMDAFFPGPLTIVFRRPATVSATVTGGQNTIGIRMPDHPVPLSIIRAFGAPVVCPSANLTGRRAPMSAADVLEDLDGRIEMILDAGSTEDRVPSTVIDLSVRPARLLREGKITRDELAAFVEIAD